MAIPLPPLGPFLLLLFLFLFTFFTPTHETVSLSLSPTSLSKSGDSVLIQWSGIDSPSKLDWLGIYSPPSSHHDNFIGYKFLSSAPTWKSGSGSISLSLVNLRSNYSFRIFRWTESEVDPNHLDQDHNPLPGTAHLLATSDDELTFGSGQVPDQIHLSYTDAEDEMRVMFLTSDGDDRTVRYGQREDSLDEVAAARVGRYEREHMCDSPANASIGWRDPGFIHDAVMTRLGKGVRYYYKVGSDSGGWSETHSFVSRNGDSDETIAFMFGDMGTATSYSTFLRTQDESIATVKLILRDIETLGDKPAFVSHIGDISYARGYSWLWDHFFSQIEPLATKLPYHVCIGNHEYDWPLQPWKPEWASMYGKDGGGECGVPYSLKFNMPGNSAEPTGTNAPDTRNLYYSFDMGSVHFVYFSTETNFVTGSKQFEFMKHDLETVDRRKTPFVVVQGHRPMYTTSNERGDAPLRQRMLEHLEPLLVNNNVTLALWGHVHRYERFCPMSNYTCGSALPVHVVIGMAGQDWQPIWEPRPDHLTDPVYPQPERSMYRGGEFGYTRLVATREKLTLSYVGNHDGKVHDTVEFLASGQVLGGNGAGGGGIKSFDTDSGAAGVPGVIRNSGESTFSWFVKGTSVLVLGVFIGYVGGYVSYSRKKPVSGNNWTPVKSEEM